MAQFGRPNQDVSTTGWTKSAGTYFYECVDETPYSDADYVRGTGAVTIELKLSSVTDPVSAAGHIVRWRAISNGTGAAEKWTVSLYQGASLIAALITTTTITRAWTNYEIALSSAQADAITNYADLRIRIALTTMGAAETVDVSFMEMQVPSVVLTAGNTEAASALSSQNTIQTRIAGIICAANVSDLKSAVQIRIATITGIASAIVTENGLQITASAIDEAVSATDMSVAEFLAAPPLEAEIAEVISGTGIQSAILLIASGLIESVSAADVQSASQKRAAGIVEALSVSDVENCSIITISFIEEIIWVLDIQNGLCIIVSAIVETVSAVDTVGGLRIITAYTTEPGNAIDICNSELVGGVLEAEIVEVAFGEDILNEFLSVSANVNELCLAEDIWTIQQIMFVAILETINATSFQSTFLKHLTPLSRIIIVSSESRQDAISIRDKSSIIESENRTEKI